MRSIVFRTSLFVVSLSVVLPSLAHAELSRDDRKQIKQVLDDADLWMRVDAPCATGRHPYGTYQRPLVEISPDGVNTDADDGDSFSWWHADSTYWGIRINDPVEVDEFDIEADDGEVEIELEGRGSADDEETVILFTDIYSFDDFQAAFDLAFARRPLQDEHDDWSAEMKDAIGERRLVDGMSKRMVFYVTGRPERFETRTEDGTEVEIWHLRTDRGRKTNWFFTGGSRDTGMPSSLRFEDGLLVGGSGAAEGNSEFSID
jgi:hypothetical protein